MFRLDAASEDLAVTLFHFLEVVVEEQDSLMGVLIHANVLPLLVEVNSALLSLPCPIWILWLLAQTFLVL